MTLVEISLKPMAQIMGFAKSVASDDTLNKSKWHQILH